MNKLLGAMVLLLGVTSAAVSGSASVDVDKMAKSLNNQAESHIMQIAELDEGELSLLCEEIANETTQNSQLKNTLLNECKLKLEVTDSEIAEQIKIIIENN